MRILINHLTRMKHPFVCVAGVLQNGSHVRPVLDQGQLGRALLRSEGGPFALGSVVDLGPTSPRPVPPEKEDVVFLPQEARQEKSLGGDRFEVLMRRFAQPSLREVFGDGLVRLSRTSAAVAKGQGIASLGVVQVAGSADLEARESYGTPEIRFTYIDSDLGELSLKVTDLRLWRPDYKIAAFSQIEAIHTRLQDCLVAVGLTRAHAVSSYPGSWHWLQVNNIFPIGDPLWARE